MHQSNNLLGGSHIWPPLQLTQGAQKNNTHIFRSDEVVEGRWGNCLMEQLDVDPLLAPLLFSLLSGIHEVQIVSKGKINAMLGLVGS